MRTAESSTHPPARAWMRQHRIFQWEIGLVRRGSTYHCSLHLPPSSRLFPAFSGGLSHSFSDERPLSGGFYMPCIERAIPPRHAQHPFPISGHGGRPIDMSIRTIRRIIIRRCPNRHHHYLSKPDVTIVARGMRNSLCKGHFVYTLPV